MTADTFQTLVAGLPSPTVSDDVDSKPVDAAASNAVPCRRSSRQRRRTAKAAEEAELAPLDEVATPAPAAPRRHRTGGRASYVCELCDKEFTKHSSLVRHNYQHSGQID